VDIYNVCDLAQLVGRFQVQTLLVILYIFLYFRVGCETILFKIIINNDNNNNVSAQIFFSPLTQTHKHTTTTLNKTPANQPTTATTATTCKYVLIIYVEKLSLLYIS